MVRFLKCVGLALSSIGLVAELALGTEGDQLGAEIEVLTLREGARFDEVAYAQRSRGDRLVLDANACFFYPVGPRLLDGGASRDEAAMLFNKGERYAEIGMIQNIGQEIKWPILPVSSGSVSLTAFLKVSALEAGSEWIVKCGDIEQLVVAVESDGSNPQPWRLAGRIEQSGIREGAIQFASLELVSRKGESEEAGRIEKLEIEGSAMKGAYLLRSRWRPQAVHTRFSSTEQMGTGLGIKAWVVEVKPHFDFAFDPFQFYAPVTTEFGYYGSTFMPISKSPPDLFTAKPMNFSLWSYKRGAVEPPLGELSHLLAIGDPTRQFGGYHHEGTGVKPRGALPQIEGQSMRSLILGMRFDAPDEGDAYPYRTYHSYFVDPESGEWALYASGRQYSDDPGKYGGLREPGAFVEVPGRVVSQRTHQSLRSASYRGWIQDTSGKWHPIDTMKGTTKIGEIAPKRWEIGEDAWFRMTTGGMVYRRFKTKNNDVRQAPSVALPGYMQAAALAGFYRYPVSIEASELSISQAGDLRVAFELRGNAAPAEVKLFYGSSDGLTLIFEDGDQADKWEGSVSSVFEAGRHVLEIPSASIARFVDRGYCRLLVNSEEGRFWSLNSYEW